MSLKKILALVFGWRLILILVVLIAPNFISYHPSFPYAKELLSPLGTNWISGWGGFDGVHYLTIISKGYLGTGSIQAFFPLYPLIIKTISLFGLLNPIIVGTIFSTICLIFALYSLHKLIIIDHSSDVAKKTIWLLLLFPTAFFFTAIYTESLFLLLTVLSLYMARKNNFLIAGLIAGLASATRITGIVLLPVLLIEYLDQNKGRKVQLGKITPILFSTTGLLAFMTYLKKVFSDPLLFIHVQKQFGVGRQTDKLIMIYQVFWRYVKMLTTVDMKSYLYYTVSLEFIIGLSFLILCLLAFKHTRKSYAFLSIASYIIPTLTGTFTSMPRYVLVIFPAFIVLAQILKGKKYQAYLTISGILLIINTMLFIQGHWIA